MRSEWAWAGLVAGLLGISTSPAGGALCNSRTGLEAPLRPCTEADPCTNVAFELGAGPLTTPVVVPTCRTTEPGALPFDDGSPASWIDPSGVERYACVFRPAGASATSPRPLVVFLHGGGGGVAGDVYNFTTLRAKAPSFDLTGDPTRPGFHLVSVQGRSLHYPTNNDRDGHHHDFYFRDLASPSANPDVANADRLIDSLSADGSVDPSRIYLMGWSNGGFFSQMYGIGRHDRPTPGGHRVAAVSVYTAADPFHNVNDDQSPSCQLDPYPRSRLPIMITGRACDVVACDAAQAQGFREAGFKVEPGHVAGPWVDDLWTKAGDRDVRRLIVDSRGLASSTCAAAAACPVSLGLLNHVRWPNGVADGSNLDREPEMLGFLRDHPLGGGTGGVSFLLPVVLDVAGVPPARFTSDLVAVNRGAVATRVLLRYAPAPGTPGTGGADLVETIGAGRELRIPDVLEDLRQHGWSLPRGTTAVGSLTVTFPDVADRGLVFVGSRTSSPDTSGGSGGTFGLFTAGTAVDRLPEEPLTILGLQEDEAFRSNLAVVGLPSGSGGAVVAVQVVDGDTGKVAGDPVYLTLQHGDWKQINSVLAQRGVRNGWARVTRVGGGTDPFFAYGVVNDGPASGGGTSDGSLVPPGASEGLVPIVLRVPSGDTVFTSELVLTNISASDRSASLVYTMAEQLSAPGEIRASVRVPAGHQVRIPDVVSFLWSTLPSASPVPASQGGTLMVSGGVAALVRTSNPASGRPGRSGTFGLSYPAFGGPTRATGEAWVFGLRQDQDARSNLAIADARIGDRTKVSYLVDVYDSLGGSGTPAATLGPFALPGGGWTQISGVLSQAGLTRGYARVRVQIGASDFVAYGVVNDGASPGKGTSDGSYIPGIPGAEGTGPPTAPGM